jgi:Fe2+ or Zn2+ uptake regulation protein
MRIQYVSTYINLSEEGLVEKLNCPVDNGSLFSSLDQEDNIVLCCLECNYKKIIGLDFYDKIQKTVDRIQSQQ